MWSKKESYYDPKTNTLHNVPSNRSYPYKVTRFDPKTGRYNVIGHDKTFSAAYSYPEGTHVMQTHGTNAEMQHAANVPPSTPEGTAVERLAIRAGAGFMVGAPIGAAVGGMAGGPLGAGFGALTGGSLGAAVGAVAGGGEPLYELPVPIITPKAASWVRYDA